MNGYISRHNQVFGPYSMEQITSYLQSGNVLLTDLFCAEGTEKWQPLYRTLKPSKLPDAQYHIARAGARIGEVSLPELISGVEDGRYVRSDHYWRNGQSEWLPLWQLLQQDAKEYVIVERGGVHNGPYGADQVQQYLQNGKLSCHDKAWVPWLPRWVILQDLLDFLGIELEYYIERNGERYGPYNRKQLDEFRESENLGDEDIVTGQGGYESRGSNFGHDPSPDTLPDPFDEIDDNLSDEDNDDALATDNTDDGLAAGLNDDTLADDNDDDEGGLLDLLEDED